MRTDAGVDAFEPGQHHQQRRLAGAGRADDADRLAACHIEADAFQHMHARRAVAERELDPAERDGRAVVRRGCRSADDGVAAARVAHARSYGSSAARVQGPLGGSFRTSACDCRLFVDGGPFAPQSPAPGRGRPSRPVGSWRLGDSLTAGLGLPASQAFPARLQAALKAKGHRCRDRQCRRVGRHRRRRARAGSTGRCRTRPTASSWRSAPTTCCAGLDPALTATRSTRSCAAWASAKFRCCWPACAPRRISARISASASRRSIRSWPPKYGVLLYPFLLDGVAADAKLYQRDGIHPTAAGVDRMVDGHPAEGGGTRRRDPAKTAGLSRRSRPLSSVPFCG